MKFCVIFLSALGLVSAASGATIFSDGFAAAVTAAGGSVLSETTTVGNFNVTANNVDLLSVPGPYSILCPTGVTACVDLDGSGGNAQGTISATIALVAGQSYTLTFDLSPAQRGTTASTTVSLGSYFNQTYTDPSVGNSVGVVTDTFTATSSGNVTLTFASNTAGQIGDILSGVSVSTAAVAPAPEPASVLLMGLPLIAFGAFAYRRRAKA